jgi:hypothetical protein
MDPNYTGNVFIYESFIFFVLIDPNLDPSKLMPEYQGISMAEKENYINIRKLIYEEPLHRVPLYINTFPTIVSWRLEIGK